VCLDSIARSGVAFTSATAQAPYTRASVASLLTGRYPTSAAREIMTTVPGVSGPVPGVQLGAEVRSIASFLRERGYTSAAFSANPLVNHRIVGLRSEFDHFDADLQCSGGDCAAALGESALKWLVGGTAQPWFCYVHYMDVHHPYNAPGQYARRFSPGASTLPPPTSTWMRQLALAGGPGRAELEHVVGMYDAEVAYVDDQIRTLLARLRASGLAENLLIVVASDHGDEFFEHGWYGHSHTLYEELTRCPLIFSWAGRIPAGVLVASWVQNIDIVPTLLEVLGLERPAGLDGRSLVPHFDGDPPTRPAFSETKGVAVRRGAWKLWHEPSGLLRLFDLVSDPTEQVNMAEAEPDTVKVLSAILTAWKRRLACPAVRARAAEVSSMDSATVDMLRTLGYIE
jgi:arylsulfatase A-like enzyme